MGGVVLKTMGAGGGAAPLRGVRVEELSDTRAILERYRDAVRLRQVEPGRELEAVAAAERALRLADRNPAGFWAALVRRGQWLLLERRDLEAARRRMESPETITSADADVLSALRAYLRRSGYRVNEFDSLRQRYGWTRERYEAARAALSARET